MIAGRQETILGNHLGLKISSGKSRYAGSEELEVQWKIPRTFWNRFEVFTARLLCCQTGWQDC